MLIPIGTTRTRRRAPAVTYAIILICVFTFIVQAALPREEWASLLIARSGFEWWQLFSSTLLHGGLLHLIFNMIILLALGPNVEDKLGHIRYLLLYLLGAAASGFAHIAFSQHPALGASGAIAAVTGAYLVLFPATRIVCFAFWITVVGRVAIPAWWFIGLSIAIDLLAGGFGGNTGIAHAAHLGGYAMGFFSMMVLLQTKLLAREPQDLFTIFRQKRRKAAIQAAVREQQTRIEKSVGAQTPVPAETRRMHEARADIARLVGMDELDEAAKAYERFTREHSPTARGAVLAANQQLKLAEFLLRQDRPALALQAFHGFVAAYPRDRQTPSASLMMGLLLSRRLGKPAEARPHLQWAVSRLTGEDQALAQQLLAEIDAAPPPADS